MIESTSLYLANKIKSINPDETPSVNVMRYSIKFIMLNIITFGLIIISGLLFNDFGSVMICTFAFVLLRFFAGGYHISNAWLCAIASTTAVHILVIFGNFLNYIPEPYTQLINYVTLGLVSYFSPSNIEKQTRFKKENYKWLKVISIAIVLSNIFLFNSSLLASSFLFLGLTLINFTGKVVKRDEENRS